MCIGPLFSRPRMPKASAAPIQTAPTPAPPPEPVVQTPVDTPTAPTPGPKTVDPETTKPTSVTGKKINKKARAKGTSQLAVKKPATGGVKGTGGTGTGVNVGGAKPKATP